jgi:hypothetical protein
MTHCPVGDAIQKRLYRITTPQNLAKKWFKISQPPSLLAFSWTLIALSWPLLYTPINLAFSVPCMALSQSLQAFLWLLQAISRPLRALSQPLQAFSWLVQAILRHPLAYSLLLQTLSTASFSSLFFARGLFYTLMASLAIKGLK